MHPVNGNQESAEVAVANRQSTLVVNESILVDAARCVLADHGPPRAAVSIAVVDDVTIHELNRRYLQHDYPTDVLSFVLESTETCLDGEVIVSADTAARCAPAVGWSAESELVLYLVHGVLHLVGYDDHTMADRREMRCRERHFMGRLGRPVPDGAEP